MDKVGSGHSVRAAPVRGAKETRERERERERKRERDRKREGERGDMERQSVIMLNDFGTLESDI